ncbi:MAG: ABC transporter permease [Burkholderiales bacterium PBB4]|nr:MAG: ABC transporter permease [Burkholderiales bacterium PBB4]
MHLRSWLLASLVCWVLGFHADASAQKPAIRIGAEDDWAPFSSAKNGTPVGMAVDIVKAIFAEAGLALELVPLPYARCMEEARIGRVAGCFDTLPDDLLRKDFWFHAMPLFSDPILILARGDDPAVSLGLKGLEGKRVITTHGYTYGDAFEVNRSIQRVNASHDVNALRMLDAKRGDYALVYQRITNLLLQGEAKGLAGKIKSLGPLIHADLYIAFSRKHPGAESLVQQFDAAHGRLLKNQTIAKIEKRWN